MHRNEMVPDGPLARHLHCHETYIYILRHAMLSKTSENIRRHPEASGDIRRHPATSGDIRRHPDTSVPGNGQRRPYVWERTGAGKEGQ
jgi:hypothetical protein